jgi:hypothetical protein
MESYIQLVDQCGPWKFSSSAENLVFQYKFIMFLNIIHRRVYIVTCRPIARELLRKQARNKHTTNNTVDPFLGNNRNTHTQQQN